MARAALQPLYHHATRRPLPPGLSRLSHAASGWAPAGQALQHLPSRARQGHGRPPQIQRYEPLRPLLSRLILDHPIQMALPLDGGEA